MTTSRLPFDAVLCDLDGVIRHYDSAPLHRLERAVGVAEGTTARIAFSSDVDRPALLGQISTAQWVENIALRLVGHPLPPTRARELAAAFEAAPFRADEEVVAMLRRVRGRVPLVLVTNATSALDGDLARLGLADLADHIVSSARVGVAKPDRRIYDLAAERAGAAAERCLFVDDRPENVRAATALGMTGLHYRTPADLRTALGPLLAEGAPA
ncbi:HAD family hydrolase [Streptomyces sp. NPDC092296]|uniref:HAD family hydrolase n=1 Tax=Streptomyces sp. NPDC092296 TaxID=3366012 RepID=UPI0037F79373